MCCSNVEKDKFICALGGIPGSQLNGIAGVAQINEINALDSPAVLMSRHGIILFFSISQLILPV